MKKLRLRKTLAGFLAAMMCAGAAPLAMAGQAAVQTVSAAETLVNYVTTDDVNYRSKPSTSAAKKGTLKKGTVVQVVKSSATKANGYTWFKLKINGKYYYSVRNYLKKQSAVNVSLNKTSATIYRGGNKLTLKANTSVTWKSSNKSVATVSSKGVVTAKGAGTATITATSGSKSASCKVTVCKKTFLSYVTTAKVSYRSAPSTSGKRVGTLKKGTTVAIVKGYHVKANGYTWYKAKINSKTYYIANSYLKKNTAATKVTLAAGSTKLAVGASTKIKATLTPAATTSKVSGYESSDTSVVTVSSSGKVTAKGVGTATVTATTDNGKKATIKFTVKEPVPATSVSLNLTKTTITMGGVATLTTTMNDYASPLVTWKSSNTSVASVDENGKVTGIKVGSATITVTTASGITAKCVVTVVKPSGASLGVDVSTWQGVIDWDAVKKSGVKFAILRAGYGRESSQYDTYFEQNYYGAKSAGLKVGVYWYSYAGSDSVEPISDCLTEAKACYSIIKGKSFELPIFFDIEESALWAKAKEYDDQTYLVTAMAKKFCNYIIDKGFKSGLYMSAYPLGQYVSSSFTKSYPIWVARYGAAISDYYSGPYMMWQYSSSGQVSGIKGNVDVNYCYTL